MPPTTYRVNPDSTRTRLRLWINDHPTWHTSGAIAEGLRITDPAERTALIRELNRLTRTGAVLSYRPPNLAARGPGTLYARTGTPPPDTATA